MCGNYRGLLLLSTAGKILSRILLDCLTTLVENVLPGFQSNRGAIDMIFVAQQLMEKAREQQKSMFFIFFDLEKAFDSMPRPVLWNILSKFGFPNHFIDLVHALHDDMKGCVCFHKNLSKPFYHRLWSETGLYACTYTVLCVPCCSPAEGQSIS